MASFGWRKEKAAELSCEDADQVIVSQEVNHNPITELSPSASGELRGLVALLRGNGIEVIDDWSVVESEHKSGYRAGALPYIRIETTQIFSSPTCAMTYLCKQWRDSPFALGDLSYIDISISDQNTMYVSTLSPYGESVDNDALLQMLEQMESLLPQCIIHKYGLVCSCVESIPYLFGTIEPSGTDPVPTEALFDMIQFMALDVHLVFSNISSPLRKPYKLPRLKSEVPFTPDVQDARGGYFVYGPDGSLWWLVDENFKFKSVVGRHIWQEFLDAEEMGKPLTFADMDNLYYYENGMLYQSDGTLKGRYSHERLR